MFKNIKKDFTLMALLLIPVAVAIDFIGTNLANLLNLPLFLSSIGSVVAGMLAGPWVAMVTGVVGSAIKSVFNPTLIPFAITTASIGITIGILGKYGMVNKWWKVVVSGIIVGIVSGAVSVPITALVFGGFTGHGSDVLTATFLSMGFGLWGALILEKLVTEMADKIPTVIIGFLIVKSMSQRYLSKFNYGYWYLKNRNN